MHRLRLLAAAAAGTTVALLSMAGPSTSGGGAAVEAQAARTVAVDPGPLAPGTMATVRWTGFRPGPAYVYICERPLDRPLPAPENCFGDTLVTGETAADGTGSASFMVRSALVPYGTPRDDSPLEDQPGGRIPLDCRGIAGCAIAVTECSTVLTDATSAVGAYGVTPAEPATETADGYDDDPLVQVAWNRSDDDGDGLPDLNPVLTRRPPVEVPVEPEEPFPTVTGPRIAAQGSDIGRAVHGKWGRAIARGLDITVNSTYTDAMVGISAVLSGSADVAYSGVRATADQSAQAAAQGQGLVYVPLSISTTAIGYNVYPLLPMRDLRLSATSVAGLLWPGGQPASDIVSGALGRDQGACRPTNSRVNVVYSKGGRSEAHLSVSSWLDAAWRTRTRNPPPWKFGAVDILPSSGSTAQPQQTNDAVPARLALVRGGAQTTLSFAARFGLMDTTLAIGTGVQSAWLQNEAGAWVQPSPAGALATLLTSSIGTDNVVDIDEMSKDPAAYPLVVVNYAVAPTTLTEDFTATDADAVRRALAFMISTDGQRIAAEDGFVPLTADLTIRAATALAQIGSITPPAPTTTVAPPTTLTTAAVAPTVVATTVPQLTPAAAPASRSSGGSTARPSSGATPTPATNRPGTTVARPTTSVTTETTTAPTTATVRDATAGAATASEPDEPPPDIFDSLFDAAPAAPDLPVLGAAGATVAVAGQGINLWRVSRKRPRAPGL